MKNKNINDLLFDYFSNTKTYVRTILDILPEEEVPSRKKAIIIELFNCMLYTLSQEELKEIVNISRLYNEQIALKSSNEVLVQARFIYKNFLDKMLFDSSNRRLYFGIMNECIKVSADYYQNSTELEKNNLYYEINYNTIGNIASR